jgi:hypothetical protein
MCYQSTCLHFSFHLRRCGQLTTYTHLYSSFLQYMWLCKP